MKLKFKVQDYQTNAVESVVDCFAGQPNLSGLNYQIDPGKAAKGTTGSVIPSVEGFKNADIQLSDVQLLNNIHQVQTRQNLPVSDKVVSNASSPINLDVEMETGTGKTYCYIKTIFEMNQRYGWSKFIIVVPSIAIREGVYKSLNITAEHFSESYGKKARFFIYSSKNLPALESFSSDAGINVMVINIQAFNATGKDNRRIYEELDDFQSRKPIDVISKNRPILILDEPQKMEGRRTLDALAKFNPLMVLRYSATHKTTHNKIHRLDALDAYNQKLVKKISVRGINVKGLSGTSPYLYLESIEISKSAPKARIDMEIKQVSGIKRIGKKIKKGDNLYDLSNNLDQYKGFVVSNIDARDDTVEFLNGEKLYVGDATGDVTEDAKRRIQIRETIKAHFEKERRLFSEGIKVLSLFFIDEVARYRDYAQPDDKGDYARIFEEEYETLKKEYLSDMLLDKGYRSYLERITSSTTHNGYFSIDKKSKQLKDPKFKTRGEQAGLSDDVDAYDLILKDKEKLLSFEEPTRFIFSHSALREGWDNPNVFVMCMLKHSDNTISRRQEVGRGLRLSVNQHGERQDHPATVHEINILSVVASESYTDFVTNLQREISDSLSERPRKADIAFFTNKVITTETGTKKVDETMAKQIYKYLLKNDYINDSDDSISADYHEEKANGTLAALPSGLAPYQEQVFNLIDSVFSEGQIQKPEDGRTPKINPLNANFKKKEFQALWQRINKKAVYRVEFDSDELIKHSVQALDKELIVTPLQYTIQTGTQVSAISDSELSSGQSFKVDGTKTEFHNASVHSSVTYDLIGNLAEKTHLTRKTVATILAQMLPIKFSLFKQNPEHFLAEASRLINEQKASVIINKLKYDTTDQTYDTDIFTASQAGQDFSCASDKLKKHIYDYLVTDSKGEQAFAAALESDENLVAVYAKLPRGFFIPTPVGDYNPDWAISFKEGTVKHIYFIAETKGSMSTMQLRGIEERKIACARQFFKELNRATEDENVTYDVVTDYDKLMSVVGGVPT
ncbi:DEAD/DEAH box helicase family protein [Endozoicomonas sp. Mp262]|uniref:type III restriction-modification system endonuclease n=1 Tax=Endozoicomonas sp. Mp262 TaxID=2919499 RepID=UPI0021DFCC95